MIMHSGASSARPDRTFDNIGTALREVATIVSRLEEAALQMCVCATDLPQKTKSLQDFDLVLQSLADLATLMEGLGEHGPVQTASHRTAIIARMRLAWLRDLIGDDAPQSDHDQTRIAIF
ncbi:hypothetical protein [Yoonia vestfoldensis]|uniref:hypothetical protein n=1 Tax=Yoonia vestfoldensis TaxID=245188 RepID=UPI000373B2B0|nr:hypothetical protein [Yoonia vestfoldensis]